MSYNSVNKGIVEYLVTGGNRNPPFNPCILETLIVIDINLLKVFPGCLFVEDVRGGRSFDTLSHFVNIPGSLSGTVPSTLIHDNTCSGHIFIKRVFKVCFLRFDIV